jgi:diaminopropionate ammonia-lyase
MARAETSEFRNAVFEHLPNPLSGPRSTNPEEAQAASSLVKVIEARNVIRTFPGYCEAPLIFAERLAAEAGIGLILVKDESARFGLAFKALGGPFAIHQALAGQTGAERSAQTVACASAGNHGMSVAWGAHQAGCRAVIYLPRGASPQRAAAMRAFGAEVVAEADDYDQAVAQVEADAARNGWIVISDTAYPGMEEAPRNVMLGYRTSAGEILEQIPPALLPTHVFVQAGVGAIAAAFCAHFAEALGARRPRFVLVESITAACLMDSARRGEMTTIKGPFDTRMGGLAAGVPSALAWPVLAAGVDDFVAISDAPAQAAALMLRGELMQPSVSASACGAAGLGALMVALARPGRRRALGLTRRSRALVIVTEGETL